MLVKHKSICTQYSTPLDANVYTQSGVVVKTLLLIILCFTLHNTLAQDNASIREGNKLYRQKKYAEAQKKYMQASTKQKDARADFNANDAIYEQGKYADAQAGFKKLVEAEKDPNKKAVMQHNLGNSFLKEKKYEEALQAYKQSLMNNPADDDTRYNLVYAQKKIQQQKQDDKKNKDKNKDKKDDKKDKDKKDDKKEGDKDKDKKDDKKDGDKGDKKDDEQANKPNPNQISKEDAERMLQALNKNEKNLNDKLKKQQVKASSVNIEKDW